MWDQNKEKLGVTGHRGCKDYMPENTLISFREAFCLGVDVLEFDIQLTRDDVMIVMHDSMVDRTTDGTGSVWFKTLEEVKALDAGVKFGFPGERVPTFEEALECIRDEAPAHMVLNVEIKEQRPHVVDVAIELLEKYGLLERSVIASFDAQTLLYVGSLSSRQNAGSAARQDEALRSPRARPYVRYGRADESDRRGD